jgi:hypothetical protein
MVRMGAARPASIARLRRAGGASPEPNLSGFWLHSRGKGVPTVKKLLILAVVALGGFVVWRRLQQDREELDLWTEATSTDS